MHGFVYGLFKYVNDFLWFRSECWTKENLSSDVQNLVQQYDTVLSFVQCHEILGSYVPPFRSGPPLTVVRAVTRVKTALDAYLDVA